MSTIEHDGEQVQKRMHDAISNLMRASAANDALLDQLFDRVVALEQANRLDTDHGSTQ